MTEGEDDLEIVNGIMDALREALEGCEPEHSATALAGILGEVAINATAGQIDMAEGIISDLLECIHDTLQAGAALIAATRQGGPN